MVALVPGGVRGVLLKSQFPCRYAYADNWGRVFGLFNETVPQLEGKKFVGCA